MSFSRFEQVLIEEALENSPPLKAYRPSFNTPGVEKPQQVAVAVDRSYSEFREQLDRSSSVEQDWQLVLSQLASLSESELRALRRVAAQHLHPDRTANRKSAADMLAVLNADIDRRLKALAY